MSVMFKDEDARESIRRWHQRFRDTLTTPTASREIETRFGATHVLIGGPEDAPPVVLLHGALASSAHVLGELQGLMAKLRVYAVDVLGQSAMSADRRIDPRGDDYGRWLIEVLDALDLKRPRLIAISWGGFVALRLAKLAPERIERLALLVPAGVVNGPMWTGTTKMMWPMMRYTWRPTRANRDAFLQNLLSTPDDTLWADYLGEAFLRYKLNMVVPKLATADELKGLTAPTLLIGADEDISFPGDKLIARGRALLPALTDHEVIRGCKHSPPTTPEFRAWLTARVATFLLDSPAV